MTGARRVVVLTEDVAEDGTSKRPFPSPGDDGVYRIITKMAVFDATPAGPELAPSPRTRHRPASHQYQRPVQGQQTPSSPLPGGDMSESPEAPAVQQRGLWFEKLHSRVVEQHSPGGTLSEADNTQFSTMTMNPPFAPPGCRVHRINRVQRAAGQHLAHHVGARWALRRSPHPGHHRGQPGFPRRLLPRPVRHGDTIHGETVVTERRLSSGRPGVDIVTFEHTEHAERSQRSEVVAVVTRTTLMCCKPEASHDRR